MFQGEEQTHSQERLDRSQAELPQHPKAETQRKRERTVNWLYILVMSKQNMIKRSKTASVFSLIL